MYISQKNFYAIFFGMLAILISLYITPMYINGDQIAYNGFFDNCVKYKTSIINKWTCYNSSLGSKEPGYFIIMNFIGVFFGKNIITILANFLILFFLSKIVFDNLRSNLERFVVLFLMISNFYILVLFFSAERFKFSFIFFLICFIYTGWRKYIYVLISVFTHTQMLILFLSFYINYIYNSNLSLAKKIRFNVFIVFSILAFFVLGKDHIFYKFNAYSAVVQESDAGLFSLFKVSILYFITLISYPRVGVSLAGIPVLISAYFLGSTRIMMIMFFLYFFTIILFKRKIDIFFYLVMFYFSLKSIDFVRNIMLYGEGFNIL